MSPGLVAGKRMVLMLSGYTTIDGQALLEDVGRLPDGKRVVFTLPTPDGVSFTPGRPKWAFGVSGRSSPANPLVHSQSPLALTTGVAGFRR